MSQTLRLGIAKLGVASTQILPAIAALPYIKITAAADTRGGALEKIPRDLSGAAPGRYRALDRHHGEARV